MVHCKYVFHHIPKAAGSSCRSAFKSWFNVIYDYKEGWGDEATEKILKNKKDLDSLSENDLLCGHFDFDGMFLEDRYPEILEDQTYKIITFLRDPLQLVISDHFYLKARKPDYNLKTLWDRAKVYPNYMSRVLKCNEENYREVLNRYWFIGIVEKMDESFKLLAKLLGKPEITIPALNVSDKDEFLTDQQIQLFKEKNQLDYKIYQYGLELFEKKYKETKSGVNGQSGC